MASSRDKAVNRRARLLPAEYRYKLNQGFPTKPQTPRINNEIQEWFILEAEKEDAMETTMAAAAQENATTTLLIVQKTNTNEMDSR